MSEKKDDCFYLSFVEEFWNGQIEGSSMGRIEVKYPNSHPKKDPDGYHEEEIRWGFFKDKREDFEEFREAWDDEGISEKMLKWLRKYMGKVFMVKKERKE